MALTDLSTPCLNYREQTPPSIWGLTLDCPENFENGKFMVPLGQLIEEPWEVLRFHLWYMNASKLGMKDFVYEGPQGVLPLDQGL
jgi:hypothetical protein